MWWIWQAKKNVFEDTRTQRGFVKRETDAKQIFVGGHGKVDRFTTANETQSDLAI
jgi:hypothetical protein